MDVAELDLVAADGRRLHAYDTGESHGPVVVWHHGTPNIGAPPAPLLSRSAQLGVRWIGVDRPGYGGSTARPGRRMTDVASDVIAVLDALELDAVTMLSHSGGGPHALACAALAPDRVVAVATLASMAPFDAADLDWFAGMGPAGTATLRAAAAGRAAKEAHEASAGDDAPDFTASDVDMFAGPWSWLMEVVGPALAGGPGALIDDDLACVAPWGFDVGAVVAPVLVVHGDDDRVVPVAHGEWLAAHLPSAELRRVAGDGHISVLRHAESALEWLAERARQ